MPVLTFDNTGESTNSARQTVAVAASTAGSPLTNYPVTMVNNSNTTIEIEVDRSLVAITYDVHFPNGFVISEPAGNRFKVPGKSYVILAASSAVGTAAGDLRIAVNGAQSAHGTSALTADSAFPEDRIFFAGT